MHPPRKTQQLAIHLDQPNPQPSLLSNRAKEEMRRSRLDRTIFYLLGSRLKKRDRKLDSHDANRIALPSTREVDGRIGKDDGFETDVESFDTLHERALDDPDFAVRLAGIEAAISLPDKDSFDLLWLAVNSDDNADNRLSAVSELEQMIKSGIGDSEQILELLEDTAGDTDPRVAELSQLIIQEQFGGPEELPQVDEEEEAEPSDDDMADYQEVPETDADAFDKLRNAVLFDPDSAVRRGGIEAVTDPHEDSLELLREAALGRLRPG